MIFMFHEYYDLHMPKLVKEIRVLCNKAEKILKAGGRAIRASSSYLLLSLLLFSSARVDREEKAGAF